MVVRIDRNVVVAEVAGPDGGHGIAPTQTDSDEDLALGHDPGAIGLLIRRVPSTARGHVNIVQMQIDEGRVEVVTREGTRPRVRIRPA